MARRVVPRAPEPSSSLHLELEPRVPNTPKGGAQYTPPCTVRRDQGTTVAPAPCWLRLCRRGHGLPALPNFSFVIPRSPVGRVFCAGLHIVGRAFGRGAERQRICGLLSKLR